MHTVHARCAGLDVHKKTVVAGRSSEHELHGGGRMHGLGCREETLSLILCCHAACFGPNPICCTQSPLLLTVHWNEPRLCGGAGIDPSIRGC